MIEESSDWWDFELLSIPNGQETVEYLDDIPILGMSTWYELWTVIKRTIAKLIRSGILLNIRKICLWVLAATIWDFHAEGGLISLRNRSLHSFVASRLPTTLKELQYLVGNLNYMSILVPNYCKRVALIMALLKKTSDDTWQQKYTIYLNKQANEIYQGLKLPIIWRKLPL